MYVNLTYVGNGKYRARVGKNTYEFPAQPGQVIWLGGKKVTVPAASQGSASTPSQSYNAGVPHLTADEQQDFNTQLTNFDLQEIDLGAANQQAHVNYERTIVDLARNALVSAQSVEENMAARGQFDSGVRSSALTDVERHRTLSQGRAAEDLRTADILYETKRGALTTGRGHLQNWATVKQGENAKNSSYMTQTPQAAQKPTPLTPFLPAANKPAATVKPPPLTAPGFQPGVNTHAGVAVPQSRTPSGGIATHASGPPPSPNHVWTGYKWVKR